MPTRRETVIALESIATLGTGGLALAASESAHASASVEGVDVGDAEYESQDGTIHTPWLDLDVGYDYTVNSTPEKVRALLLVGRQPDSREILVMETQPVAMQSATGTIPVAAAVVDAGDYAAADFAVETPGESVTETVHFEVLVQVRHADDGTLVETGVTGSVDVTVTHGGIVAAVDMTVGGSVVVQGNESDPRPV